MTAKEHALPPPGVELRGICMPQILAAKFGAHIRTGERTWGREGRFRPQGRGTVATTTEAVKVAPALFAAARRAAAAATDFS